MNFENMDSYEGGTFMVSLTNKKTERKKKQTILPLRESYNNSHNMLFFSLSFPLLSADKAFSSKVKFYYNFLYALASNLDLLG